MREIIAYPEINIPSNNPKLHEATKEVNNAFQDIKLKIRNVSYTQHDISVKSKLGDQIGKNLTIEEINGFKEMLKAENVSDLEKITLFENFSSKYQQILVQDQGIPHDKLRNLQKYRDIVTLNIRKLLAKQRSPKRGEISDRMEEQTAQEEVIAPLSTMEQSRKKVTEWLNHIPDQQPSANNLTHRHAKTKSISPT